MVARAGGASQRPSCHDHAMGDIREFFRNNPQAFILLVITVVLGLGTFVAVLIALASAGSTTTDGEPNDVIMMLHAVIAHVQL